MNNTLLQLVSSRLGVGKLFVVWTKTQRTACIVGSKNSRNDVVYYKIQQTDKYIIPYYRSKTVTQIRIDIPLEKPVSQYVLFDGQSLTDFSNESQSMQYKDEAFLPAIMDLIHSESGMERWMWNEHTRSVMLYKNLTFLVGASINPSLPPIWRANSNGFSARLKFQVVSNWKNRVGSTKSVRFPTKNGFVDIELVRDVVGLWTASPLDKLKYLADFDWISSYDVEHVVSNSYGSDNSDANNGVLLDSIINRGKGNTMLFLIGDHMIWRINERKEMQRRLLRTLRPWTTRFL